MVVRKTRILLEKFNELKIIYSLLGEVYKERAYAGAIKSIKAAGLATIKEQDLQKLCGLKGIGGGICGKIEEFIRMGHISEIDKLSKSPIIKAYRDLQQVIGIGPIVARKLVAAGIKSLADLRRAVAKGMIKLTHAQRLGLLYYKDLNSRIPRAECTALSNYMRKLLLSIQPGLMIETLGSYRRGLQTSGDIDMLISEGPNMYDKELISKFHKLIADDPRYIDYLAKGEQRITFLYKSPVSEMVRQIDIFHSRYESYYAYLLYATGSAEHNEYIRGLCKRKGYRLNQDGLYKISNGRLVLVPLDSEYRLYEILGIPYVKPEDR